MMCKNSVIDITLSRSTSMAPSLICLSIACCSALWTNWRSAGTWRSSPLPTAALQWVQQSSAALSLSPLVHMMIQMVHWTVILFVFTTQVLGAPGICAPIPASISLKFLRLFVPHVRLGVCRSLKYATASPFPYWPLPSFTLAPPSSLTTPSF